MRGNIISRSMLLDQFKMERVYNGVLLFVNILFYIILSFKFLFRFFKCRYCFDFSVLGFGTM
jgi:hypothetical protein